MFKILFKNSIATAIILIQLKIVYLAEASNLKQDGDENPFIDMASAFIQQSLANGNNDGSGLNAITSILGNLVQTDDTSGKSNSGVSQLLGGLSSLLGNNNNNENGFDPSIIGNLIETFASSYTSNNIDRNKRSSDNEDSNITFESVMSLVSGFMNAQNQNLPNEKQDDGLMSLLPMILQTVSSFSGSEGKKVQDKHKDHAWVLPPILEKIHVMWDHFSSSELANTLWEKSGIYKIFLGFTDNDGKLDYDKLFESLYNQSFRRKWIKTATLYLADWVNYVADPEVYQRYFQTGHLLFNGFLKSQAFPKKTFFDPKYPTETLSELLDFIAKTHLHVKFDSRTYVQPAVDYVKQLLKLGQARGILQKFDAIKLSDLLTDTVNLEVIEPVLKVHRAFRFAIRNTRCDKYILCEINSHDPNENISLPGFKKGITKFGTMVAAWLISNESGTPFWTLFSVINEPYNCKTRFPVDCYGFHEGEAKVTTEYIHNEL